MSMLLALLVMAADGPPPPRLHLKSPPATACRDERGRFRLHCFPKGTVKPMAIPPQRRGQAGPPPARSAKTPG
jgi:hypothetical protein